MSVVRSLVLSFMCLHPAALHVLVAYSVPLLSVLQVVCLLGHVQRITVLGCLPATCLLHGRAWERVQMGDMQAGGGVTWWCWWRRPEG